jgi:hypothetical protein
MQIPYLAALLPALLGIALAAIAYLAPFGNTGVDGSLGALLALLGAVAAALGSLLLLVGFDRWRRTLTALIVIVAALTTVAAAFLMQWTLAIVMLGVIAGLGLASFLPPRRRTA